MRAQTVQLGSIADRPWERQRSQDGRPFTDVEEAFFEAEPAEAVEDDPAWSESPGIEANPTTLQGADVELDPPRWHRPEIELAPPRWQRAETPMVPRAWQRRERAVVVDYRPPVRRPPRAPLRAPVRGGLMSRGTLGLVAGLAVGAGIWLAASRLTARPAPLDLARVGAAQVASQLAAATTRVVETPAPVVSTPPPAPPSAPASAEPSPPPAEPSIPAPPALPPGN